MGVTAIMDIVMNAMYPKDYRFQDIYLLTTATPRTKRTRLKGHLFCGGVTLPRDITNNDKLELF